jgi:hypothetical protein
LETRGALISKILLTVIRFNGTGRSKYISVGIVTLVGFFNLLFSFGFLDYLLISADMASGRGTGDLSGRGLILGEARRTFFNNWLFGIGGGNFLRTTERNVGAHNFFLIVALDAELVGLLVMAGTIIAFCRRTAGVHLVPKGVNLLALFAIYWLPIATSGHWELITFSWIVTAVAVQAAGFKGLTAMWKVQKYARTSFSAKICN